jgi:hypothetical protein
VRFACLLFDAEDPVKKSEMERVCLVVIVPKARSLVHRCFAFADGMLRDLPERFRREVEFHAHMGLNCIRLWGGAGIATPDLLKACDAAGLLVWYEFWITGDCNGRGATPGSPVSDPNWPLDHSLFLANAADCIRSPALFDICPYSTIEPKSSQCWLHASLSKRTGEGFQRLIWKHRRFR